MDVDPSGSLPPLRLFATEQFRCVPANGFAAGRAFHSATSLPGGQILFIGGLIARNDGKNGPATADLYVTGSIEGWNPTTAASSPSPT